MGKTVGRFRLLLAHGSGNVFISVIGGQKNVIYNGPGNLDSAIRWICRLYLMAKEEANPCEKAILATSKQRLLLKL